MLVAVPEMSLDILKQPNKKRFSFESSGDPTEEKKQMQKKKIKVVSPQKNFISLMTQIKNNDELTKNVLTNFQNLWALTHRKLKILGISDFETRYHSIVTAFEKNRSQTENSKRCYKRFFLYILIYTFLYIYMSEKRNKQKITCNAKFNKIGVKRN